MRLLESAAEWVSPSLNPKIHSLTRHADMRALAVASGVRPRVSPRMVWGSD